jgi:hypothetical protein
MKISAFWVSVLYPLVGGSLRYNICVVGGGGGDRVEEMTETNKGTREQFVVVVFLACIVSSCRVRLSTQHRACWPALPWRVPHPLPPYFASDFEWLEPTHATYSQYAHVASRKLLCPKGFRPVSSCCLVINFNSSRFCGEINERPDRDNEKCAVTYMAPNVLEIYRL